MEITGKWGKCRRNLQNSKSESRSTRNKWLTCGCEVHDGDFRKDIWVSILMPKYRYYIDTYFLRYFPSLSGTIQWFKLLNHTYSMWIRFQKFCGSVSGRTTGFHLSWHFSEQSLRRCKKFHFNLTYFHWSKNVTALLIRKNKPSSLNVRLMLCLTVKWTETYI